MKRSFFFSLLLLTGTASALRAQEYKTRFPTRDNRRIVLEMHGSNVVVEGYDGDEVIIRGNGYQEPPKQAEGLRPIYNSAEDNTRLGLSVATQGNVLRVVQASRKAVTYTLRVPRRTALVFTETNWNGSDLRVSGLAGSLELKMKNGDATLTNVTGPVVGNSTSGDITVQFASLPAEPTALSLVSGKLDVTMPAASKANLTVRSMSGEVYTDFDLNPRPTPDGLTRVSGQTVSVPLNGGGSKLALHNISGDIYVRKAK
ncbi:DUF4097 domain-containing protein [Hymenobacter sp. 5516J-16]|uniref:DUF4097 domain-containing protein n=1 Tax=Hymenobacter sublimis TaxID=2933777 RepID=A0ABY4J9A8_9BACT|nr:MULTISPECIES: DUF4097 family beta strand repeat-containing protein [Hymenobacter]UOQ78578.1 DUF4097 domain-containing protein [Hymenobacter sp. 5516J-16]UPL48558.1 DUF4097 domain-containing protein [Hymenobacter sublimis]